MVRELITVQVGQCGNQIASKFWQLALLEHSKLVRNQVYDDSLSSFFKNVGHGGRLPVGSKITELRARALVVDMEEGVVSSMLKEEIGQLFDRRQFICDVSGAGNNWAHGHFQYGRKYQAQLEEQVRSLAEECDSLQAFFMTHSLGGGTGSGVGTFILQVLQDCFPEVFRFTGSVFPSRQDDVVTSPYNSLLALNKLIEHADCVLPIDNQALLDIIARVDKVGKEERKGAVTDSAKDRDRERPYDRMNSLVAHLLSSLTCSMRFEGILNVDFNEITMNLVPFPELKFLVPAIAPLYSLLDSRLQPRRFDQMFDDVLDPHFQFIECAPLAHRYLALGFIMRGKVSFSDLNHNIRRIQDSKRLNMIHWNSEGFKYGICNYAPIGHQYSLLSLANNTCMADRFDLMLANFDKLFRRGVYVAHYEKYMEKEEFVQARGNVADLIARYRSLELVERPEKPRRLRPLAV